MHAVDELRAQQRGGQPAPALDQEIAHAEPAELAPGRAELEVAGARGHLDEARTRALERRAASRRGARRAQDPGGARVLRIEQPRPGRRAQARVDRDAQRLVNAARAAPRAEL